MNWNIIWFIEAGPDPWTINRKCKMLQMMKYDFVFEVIALFSNIKKRIVKWLKGIVLKDLDWKILEWKLLVINQIWHISHDYKKRDITITKPLKWKVT